jgi:hypothetical protein
MIDGRGKLRHGRLPKRRPDGHDKRAGGLVN